VESGYVARSAGRLVQQCGVGLVEIEERSRGVRAFAAPPARITPLPQSEFDALRQALGTGEDEIDFKRIPPSAIDNGVRWLAVGLSSPERCVTLKLDPVALCRIVQRAGMKGLALYAPHSAGGPASYEMRCIVMDDDVSVYEDPVTGSANAGLASLLTSRDARPGDHYTVRQGVAIGRAGRVFVDYDDARGKTWIGGASTTIVDGTFLVP
jgi:PhzF family phenazine biosynthesis protein